MKATTSVLLCLLALAAGFAVNPSHRKQLAGPPSEFALHMLPNPIEAIQREDSAFFETSLKFGAGSRSQVEATVPLTVDSDTAFAFSVVSKYEDLIDVDLKDPKGNDVDVSLYATMNQTYPVGDFKIPSTVYIFPNPIQGVWNLTFRSMSKVAAHVAASIDAETKPNIAVVLFQTNGFEIFTHLSTYFTHEGAEVGLVATTKSEKLSRVHSVETAVMELQMPSGNSLAVRMKDDGTHPLDMVANDGIFVGTVKAPEAGTYRAQAVLSGAHTDGRQFIRTTQHMINVVERYLTLTGEAFVEESKNSKERVVVNLVVKPISSARLQADTKVYRAYAEVWGVNSAKQETAVAWISGITHLEEKQGEHTLALQLDMNWAALAGASAPFTLKNVYVQDPESQVPLDQSASIKVRMPQRLHQYFASAALRPAGITKEMRQGKMPSDLQLARTSSKTGLVMLHGYCSTENPWNTSGSIDVFTNAHYFLNPAASITNEQFAALVIEFAKKEGLTAYALIGHSQGGMVATHILNYYFTGLDNLDSSKRLVQSVGTPYQGTTAAGSAANLAKSYGVACGSNFDLSLDGAKLWLSGISQETRKNVYFYTTTYGTGGFFGDYCSLPMNLILEYPNDGTTELINAPLPGGNDLGNTKEWCHTSGMKYKEQTADRARNIVLNSNAASN